MKYSDIKGLSDSDLNDLLIENKGKLNKLKLNHAVSPIENPLLIRTTRRTVAKVSTELNKRKQK